MSFPSAWVTLALLLILVGALFGQPAPILLAALMLAVISVSWAWNHWSLHSVRYSRSLSHTRSFPGERFELCLTVENRKLLPLGWLAIEDEFPLAAEQEAGDAISPSSKPGVGLLRSAYSLRWFERARRTYTFRAEQRGIYAIGPASLSSGDPFSIYKSDATVDSREWLIIYPRVVSLTELGLPAHNPLGDRRSQRRLFEDPNRVAGARQFQSGDSFRHVHWKATARRQELQAKVYEQSTTHTLMLCLNVATFAVPWQGIQADLLEWAMTVTASLAAWAIGERFAVGLVSNGCQAHSDLPLRLLPGRTPEHLAAMLEMLAGASTFVLLSMEKLLLREAPRLPWGATLVIITGVVTDELLATLLRLREAGRRVVLIAVGEQSPPRLAGVVAYHVPQGRG